LKTAYLPGRTVWSPQAQKLLPWCYWGPYLFAYVYVLLTWHSPLRPLLIVAGVLIPTGYSVLLKSTVKRYAIKLQPALDAMADSRPEQAERDLRALRGRFRWPRALPNLISYNLGLALHRQGRHQEAIECLAEADRRGGAVNIDGSLASSLALFHGLLGDVATAEVWLTEARQRYAGVAASASPELVSEVTLALRRHQADEVARRFERDWARIEHSRKGETLRPLRLLRAFAVAEVAGNPEAARPLLAALQPARSSDFAYLATDWPELQGFLRQAFPTPS
jgi:hypothetical protein